MSIEIGEKFIIQNFRSWKGKNYIALNNLTFLFGANSSGNLQCLMLLGLSNSHYLKPTEALDQ